MTTYKTTSGDYTITVNNGVGTMTVNAATLNVTGNITYVDDLSVTDAFITVADQNDGSVHDMGLLAQKTPGAYAGLRFDTVLNEWQVTPQTTNGTDGTWQAIATTGALSPGLPNASIQFNSGNVFTGSANLLYDSTNAQITLSGRIALGNIGTTPVAVANSAVIYNNTMSTGGTGVYFVNGTTSDEFVSYTKAKLYSIIF